MLKSASAGAIASLTSSFATYTRATTAAAASSSSSSPSAAVPSSFEEQEEEEEEQKLAVALVPVESIILHHNPFGMGF